MLTIDLVHHMTFDMDNMFQKVVTFNLPAESDQCPALHYSDNVSPVTTALHTK